MSNIEQFLKASRSKAINQARSAVHDVNAAQDIVQDAMMRLSEKYSDHPTAELPDIFYRIVQNAIRDWYRREKTKRAHYVISLDGLFDVTEEEPADPIFQDVLHHLVAEGIDKAPTPYEQLERKQLTLGVRDQLSFLPHKQREAMIHRYISDMSPLETARVMGCAEGSIKKQCHRASKKVIAGLKARGVL